jgi:hypothetical protein
MKTKLGVVILCKDEARQLEKCLKPALALGPLIVIDDFSQDQSRQAAEKFGAEFFQRKFDFLAEQRKFGAGLISSEWLLFLDADECLSDRGVWEIKNIIRKANKNYYALPRNNIVFDRVLRFGGWQPDYQLRLIKKKCLAIAPLAGEIGYLTEPLNHYSHQNFFSWWQKYQRTTGRLANQNRLDALKIFGSSLADCGRRMIRCRGYQDGLIGIVTILYLPLFSLTIIFKYYHKKLWII